MISLPFACGVRGGENRGEVVAGMRRFEREVRVVAVEIAEQDAVGEGGEIGRRPMLAAEIAGTRIGGDAIRETAGDVRRASAPRTESATERIDQAAADLVNRRLIESVEGQSGGVLGETVGEGGHGGMLHGRDSGRECRRIMAGPREWNGDIHTASDGKPCRQAMAVAVAYDRQCEIVIRIS